MAASETDIANSALIKIGAPLITALSDDTKTARICNEQFDKMRDLVLASHLWNFAVTRKELAATANTPVYKYTKEYSIPSDCLRIVEINSAGEDWEVEYNYTAGTKVILTNASSLKIKFIKKVTDTTLWSPYFDDALATRLAAEICFAVTQQRALSRDMMEDFKKMMKEYRSYDAQEGYLDDPIDDDFWLNIRG